MSLGLLLLMALSALLLLGVGQRVLDRMHLTDRQALLAIAAIFIGGLIPDIPLGRVRVNIGGALIPFALCIYLLVRAGTNKERIRALIASALTALAVYLLGRFTPGDPTRLSFDPNYVYGLAGGAIAYVLGRSRRASFIAGVLGVLIADIAVGVLNFAAGVNQTLQLGSAGALDVVVISGLLAVTLCELVGELLERIHTGAAPDAAISTGRRRNHE